MATVRLLEPRRPVEQNANNVLKLLRKRMSNIEEKLNAVREECSEKIRSLRRTWLVFVPMWISKQYIFRKIALTIGYHENNNPIVDLQRMARAPIALGTSPLILCEFALRNKRNEFYRSYLSKRSLCLRDIGLDSGNLIYMNENLTNNARQIRAEAIKLKKLGYVENVSTRNGIVHIKRKGTDKPSAIYSLQQIIQHKTPIQ